MHAKARLRVARLAGILCLFTLFFAACGSSNSPSGDGQVAPPDKQVFTMPNPTGSDFDTLDPALTAIAGDPINIIFVGLVEPQSDGTTANQLAASYTVSADKLTYTFTLKNNLKFSDGSALTAEDVAYSINRVVLPATKSSVSVYLSLLKDYDKASAGTIPTLIGDSIIVKNPKTLSLIISKPAAYFLQTLSYPTSYVVNKKIVEKYGEKWTDHLEEGAGAGPFKVQSYGHTTSLVLVPNENYQGTRPKIQKIVYVSGGDTDSNYRAYQAGQYDYASVPASQEEKASTEPGYQSVPGLASRFIGMNYLAKPFDNIKIRQAFALALNRDLIVKNVVGASATLSNHIVPKGIAGYNEKLTGPAGITSTTGDQTKAKQLLQEGMREAGYSGVDKLPSITMTYNSENKTSVDTMTAAISQWKEVLGVTVKPVGVPNTELLDRVSKTFGHDGPVQLWYGVWYEDYPDPQNWLSVFFGKGSSHNNVNYGQNTSANAKEQQAVQDKLAQADGEQDPAKRIALYQEAEQAIVNEAGWITMFQLTYSYAVNPKLKEWKITPSGQISAEEWAKAYFVQ
jgi:oligopeptide transport system substrate-binding protein